MRLIDADELFFSMTDSIDQGIAEVARDEAPTVDAVPVVRCEQCTWRYMGECMFWAGEGMYTEDNDYCSRGKRREE